MSIERGSDGLQWSTLVGAVSAVKPSRRRLKAQAIMALDASSTDGAAVIRGLDREMSSMVHAKAFAWALHQGDDETLVWLMKNGGCVTHNDLAQIIQDVGIPAAEMIERHSPKLLTRYNAGLGLAYVAERVAESVCTRMAALGAESHGVDILDAERAGGLVRWAGERVMADSGLAVFQKNALECVCGGRPAAGTDYSDPGMAPFTRALLSIKNSSWRKICGQVLDGLDGEDVGGADRRGADSTAVGLSLMAEAMTRNPALASAWQLSNETKSKRRKFLSGRLGDHRFPEAKLDIDKLGERLGFDTTTVVLARPAPYRKVSSIVSAGWHDYLDALLCRGLPMVWQLSKDPSTRDVLADRLHRPDVLLNFLGAADPQKAARLLRECGIAGDWRDGFGNSIAHYIAVGAGARFTPKAGMGTTDLLSLAGSCDLGATNQVGQRFDSLIKSNPNISRETAAEIDRVLLNVCVQPGSNTRPMKI